MRWAEKARPVSRQKKGQKNGMCDCCDWWVGDEAKQVYGGTSIPAPCAPWSTPVGHLAFPARTASVPEETFPHLSSTFFTSIGSA